MTVASSSIELEEFEQVEAAPGTVLLRVAARSSAGVQSEGPSTLWVDDGVRRHRLLPLPAPPGPAGLLRAAYSAPLELLNGRTAFALELADGSVVDLPAPRTRAKLPAHGELTARLAIDELERRLQAERDRRASAEAETTNAAAAAAEAISRLTQLEVEQHAVIAERDAATEDAQERLVAAGRELAEERARAAAELEQARAAAAEAEQHRQELQAALADAVERTGIAVARSAAMEQQMRDTGSASAKLEVALAAATAELEATILEATQRTEEAQARASTLEQVVRTESERRAQQSERVEQLVAELAALAARTAAAPEGKLEAVMLAAETRAQEQAQAEIEAAVRARPKTRAAEPPQSKEQAASEAERPRRVRDREGAPAQARPSRGETRRTSPGMRERPARFLRRLPSLQSEVVLGTCLLTLGLIVAVLFLTGEVRLGFAP